MRIAIIGAGFSGLGAAYALTKKNHNVTIFEKDSLPGGLAIGYKEKEWKWSLEEHYHHWFTNDTAILSLAKEIGHEVITEKPKSSFFLDGFSYQFDSPLAILTFPKLSLFDRIRMAFVFALLFRFNPFWKPLENSRIVTVIPKLIGKKAYKMLWEPQLVNKMGTYTKDISLVWFWARIKKRTTSLAYPKEGYLQFAMHLVNTIAKNSGNIIYNTEIVQLLEKEDKTLMLITEDKVGKKKNYFFDRVIVTVPTYLFFRMATQLPMEYKKSFDKLDGLGATNIVLRLKKQFLPDNTYWLSICEKNAPILVVVEHTNFMDKKYYNNEHIVYLGNYLKTTDPNFTKGKEELLKLYHPLLERINPNYEKMIIDYNLFRASFAQPIIPLRYSKIIPPHVTPLKNVFLANMQQVYPWDRGTNYAVELGIKVAKEIM